ncbi:MAG: type II secretion system F family protein [Bdellovibrionales bacterium]
MPTFRYRAATASGIIVKGHGAAAHENELAQRLGASGLELIAARERKPFALLLDDETKTRAWLPRGYKKIPPEALALFCQQMADILKAGVPFIDVLEDLGSVSESAALRETLADIESRIRQGQRIGGAFASFPQSFPPVFLAILSAGEASGDMAETFARLARDQRYRAESRERLRRAIRYPIFLLVLALGVASFMMTQVVPPIVSFLNDLNAELPRATRILIGASNLLAQTALPALLALLIAITIAIVSCRLSPRAAIARDRAMLRLPILGPVLLRFALARFAQSFALLFQSGLKIPEGLRAARNSLGNKALMAALDDGARRLVAGSSLHESLNELLPPFALRMLRHGERNGRLAQSLDDIASICSREAERAAERIVGGLEPTLTLFVGGLLAWIVLAVLGPVYSGLAKMNELGG